MTGTRCARDASSRPRPIKARAISRPIPRAAARGAEVLVQERTTFYGMREMVVREPGGTVLVFAEKA